MIAVPERSSSPGLRGVEAARTGTRPRPASCTPMEFVVHVVERFFNKSHDDAYQIMMHVHHNGVGECGVFTYEVAETALSGQGQGAVEGLLEAT
jgi:hypothetical protein